jgi:transketolase|tara:strand:- start:25 stop:969 length:945 start_codon:yes stop_codon:yes gene_type:complete
MVKSIREAYGKHIAKLGEKNENIILLEGDLADSTQSEHFQQAFPERYFQIGIAEQNMVGIAAGLALEGKIPVVNSFAAFIAMRACEQVRTDVAYPNLNVKFVVSHAGVSAGSAGPTHHTIEDIAIMRAIPNMTVLVPGDMKETKQVIDAAIKKNGPVYVRNSAIDVENVYDDNHNFTLGEATQLREGNDATIITTGTLMNEAVKAVDIVKAEKGLDIRLLQMASIKPIDVDAIKKAAEETGLIITIEEHNIIGGLGSAVSEVVARIGAGKVFRLGIKDKFSEITGDPNYLLQKIGLSVDSICNEINKLINKHKR